MHRRLALSALLLLPLVFVACGGSTRAAVAPPEGPRSSATIYYKFADGIEDADRKIVPEASEDSRRYFAAELGRDLKLDITVETNLEDGEGFVGTSFGRRATLLTGSPGWPNGDSGGATRIKSTIVAHEIFHNF